MSFPSACNYDENAVYPGVCDYPESGYDCDGNCLSDFDGDGVCDPFEVLGCDDPNAINYDPNATQDDGSCIPIVEGCTNADACNYNADANVEDGSCDFESCVGCLNPTACNYDADATVPGECVFPSWGTTATGFALKTAMETASVICSKLQAVPILRPAITTQKPPTTTANVSPRSMDTTARAIA